MHLPQKALPQPVTAPLLLKQFDLFQLRSSELHNLLWGQSVQWTLAYQRLHQQLLQLQITGWHYVSYIP